MQAFSELRSMADEGQIHYPYSTREVVNIVKHLEVRKTVIRLFLMLCMAPVPDPFLRRRSSPRTGLAQSSGTSSISTDIAKR